MGEQKVTLLSTEQEMQRFMYNLLNDIRALQYMIDNDWFEKDITRIGAEQEMCIVHKDNYRPALVAMEALEKLKDYPWVETELAKFNLEISLTPRVFTGQCFSQLEAELRERLQIIQEVLDGMHCSLILTGILPTLKKYHLELENLTPRRRYRALMEALIRQQLGTSFELHMEGIDELKIKHSSPLLEACNTSFQVHLQVRPDNFAKMYNIAQALAGPVLAVAANSPIVFGKRLWHESRIGLFQQSLDTRSSHEHMRERSARVNFGKNWVNESILEIYKEDIARFRTLLAPDMEENSLEKVYRGEVPKLIALQVHNSTIYRWNRPCYGISDTGKPHLRIEGRVFPCGPSIIDEVATAAFWVGCLKGMDLEVEDIRQKMSFADVRDNFMKAVRYSIDSKFTWFYDRKITAVDLVREELLPIARKGLLHMQVDPADVDHYLGIIAERVNLHRNGARWQLRGYTYLLEKMTQDEALTTLTAAIIKNQQKDLPVHQWVDASPEDLDVYRPSHLLVSECMQTDVITVQKDDIVEFVADLINWRKLRYVPVEDEKGKLVGLVTSRISLRHFIEKLRNGRPDSVTKVEDVMIKDPITIAPMAGIFEALNIMRSRTIGALPVVTKDRELVGILTEQDFLSISVRLMERLEAQSKETSEK